MSSCRRRESVLTAETLWGSSLKGYMRYSLNSLKGVIYGIIIRVMKGYTRRVYCSSSRINVFVNEGTQNEQGCLN